MSDKQPADVTDEQINAAYLAWCKTNGTPESFARAILALRPERVPMADEQADALATEAFGEYMCDLNDDIELALVRKVEAYHGIKTHD